MLRLHVMPQHPQPRLIKQAVERLRGGGLIIYPTDTTYAMGCDIHAKRTIERIYELKGLSSSHPLSFICGDLSEVATYAVVEGRNFRVLKHHMPGKYTFVLPATRAVPKLLQRKASKGAGTVGIRIPGSLVCSALIKELGHPIISTTVARSPAEQGAFTNDPDDIARYFSRSIEVFLDAGPLFGEPSSVVDLTGEVPTIIRRGSGDLSWLE